MEYHEGVAAALDRNVEDLQFQFAITTALAKCQVQDATFASALETFKLSESISHKDRVGIFSVAVVKKKKKGTGGKIGTETLDKRIEFVRSVMVRHTIHVTCAWL